MDDVFAHWGLRESGWGDGIGTWGIGVPLNYVNFGNAENNTFNNGSHRSKKKVGMDVGGQRNSRKALYRVYRALSLFIREVHSLWLQSALLELPLPRNGAQTAHFVLLFRNAFGHQGADLTNQKMRQDENHAR
jgi:hypothetical protein